jgi:acid phosphatase
MNSTPGPPSTPPTPNGVTVSCTPAAIVPDTTAQCAAKLQSGASATVTWSASGGTINASGVFTAPGTVGKVTITATETQNTAQTGTATVSVQLQLPASKHVVMVMEENQAYSTVVGNTGEWPHLNTLIGNGALATNYYADSHPSIGNYFMLTTGQLLTTNDNSTMVFNVDSIARRMLAANVSFKVYAEGIAQGYVGGNTGLYLIRHDPFAMLSDVAGSQTVADEVIQPFAQFQVDAANGALPEFSFIVPDVDDDAHNGTPIQADDWLQANVVGPLGGTKDFQQGGDGILIVDFDESLDSDTAHGGGHVAAMFWGPNVQTGYTQKSSVLYQHENTLATVMGLLGLENPPGNAATAQTMAEFFVQ